MKPEDIDEKLKETIREARGVLKDLIRERKELEKTIAKIVDGRIEDEIEKGLKEFGRALLKAVKTSEAAIFKRFDNLTETLMGEDRQSRKKGNAPLEVLLVEYMENKRD